MTAEVEWLRKTKIAQKIGVSTVTIDKYLKFPGAPVPNSEGKHNLKSVAEWIADNSPKAALTGTDIKNYRTEKIRLECKKLALGIRITEGEFIAKAELESALLPLLQEMHSHLHNVFEQELPPKFRGKNQIEIGQICAAALDDFDRRFRAGLTRIIPAPHP